MISGEGGLWQRIAKCIQLPVSETFVVGCMKAYCIDIRKGGGGVK